MVKSGGRLAAFSDERRGKFIDNYYKALKQVFPAEYENPNSVFFKTVGFGALMGALPVFLDITITESKAFRVADAAATFKRIADFDFSEWRGLSSSGAETAMAEALRTALLNHPDAPGAGASIDLD
jgi:hypothetical protein